jgi:hypothetical protein
MTEKKCSESAFPADVVSTASQCRHYAMCKIDFLETGLCPAAREHFYVSYYPQGRMDIYAALACGAIPVTQGCVEIADACTLCGICDKQCHFVTELRPMRVAEELKRYVEAAVKETEPQRIPEDSVLEKLRAIVGQQWATNDPAHLIAYSNDPSPVSVETRPRYVVLPSRTDEVAQIVRLCAEEDMEYAVRGNGSSVMGFVLSPGLVIDTARMQRIDFDEKNWCVLVGAGVSSFALQKAAAQRGYRVNTAEPSALYCANIMCSGIFSLFSSSYGTAADNVVDAEFVTPQGEVIRLSDPDAPNTCGFRREERPPPGVCTEAVVRLHQPADNESGIAVPFPTMEPAIEYARTLNRNGIGIGIGVLGTEYLSTFIAPTGDSARRLRKTFADTLGMKYVVMVLGSRYDLDAARQLAPQSFEPELMRTLMLGLPSLIDQPINDLLESMESDAPPYELLARPAMARIVESALDPSARNLASLVDTDLQEFYEALYHRPELTDMLWLNTFRIVSSRMGREGHVVAFIVYVPLDNSKQIVDIHHGFTAVAEKHAVRGDFGFITPLDSGRMAVLEWDMYLDHTNPEQIRHMQGAMMETGGMIESFSQRDGRVMWIRYLFNQGFARPVSFLYNQACGQ